MAQKIECWSISRLEYPLSRLRHYKHFFSPLRCRNCLAPQWRLISQMYWSFDIRVTFIYCSWILRTKNTGNYSIKTTEDFTITDKHIKKRRRRRRKLLNTDLFFYFDGKYRVKWKKYSNTHIFSMTHALIRYPWTEKNIYSNHLIRKT